MFLVNVRAVRVILLSTFLLIALACTILAKQNAHTYTRSWIWVDVSNGGKPLVSGEKWDVPVEYYLDPADHDTKTTLTLWGAGPWIDTPDGQYVKERGHISLPGLFSGFDLTQPGRGRHVFHFTVPPDLDLVRRNNHVLLIATFRDANGKEFPWQHRAETSFQRSRGKFEIEADTPGRLFTYSQAVRLYLRLKNLANSGELKTLNYVVHDTSGSVVASGSKTFTAQSENQRIELEINTAKRGAFLIDVDVPGWESRRSTFARIPDIAMITHGKPTPFGMTCEADAPAEEAWAVANRLGMSYCRRFVKWYRLEPGPGVYKLDALAQELDTARKHGISDWLCIGDPGPYAFSGSAHPVSYSAFEFREDAWKDFVHTATTRLKGKFLGWEWLNEITPGGCDDPVGLYTKMCEIGTATAKADDKSLITIMAGGLWPRAFRNAVLANGIGKSIDVMPVHYQGGGGVREAREDLDAAGRPGIAVWDDETAHGRNAWGVPPMNELQNTEQSDWVLRQWPDELEAGCKRITYFGGMGDAAGSWDYLLDDFGPRPVAATLAVLISKLSGAAPLGTFQEGRGGLFHLFERDGRTVLVASVDPSAGSDPIPLRVGSEHVEITDYQGNETILKSHDGVVDLPRAALPYYIEGADTDTVKVSVVPEIVVASTGSGAGAGAIRAGSVMPSVAMVRGNVGRISVKMHNPYNHRLTGVLELRAPTGWPSVPATPFALTPGQQKIVDVAVRVPVDAAVQDYPVRAAVEFSKTDARLPKVEKPAVLSVISSDMLGNLVGGVVLGPDREGKNFTISGKSGKLIPSEGLHDGLGGSMLHFEKTGGWEGASSTIPVRGGQTYLYTFWVRNHNMEAGSNMTLHMADGRNVQLFDMEVIYCGQNNPYWQMYACRKQMPPDAKSISFIPLANGAGYTDFDNFRATLYQGSDYTAEAHRAAAPPKMGGALDSWNKSCPIPIIGRNQVTYQAPGYAWTPDNLSGIAYLMWDSSNLYVAVNVRDNVHNAMTTSNPSGAEILRGDSVVIALDPTMRGPEARTRSFEYYLSSAAPGGGSGRHTLFRPPLHSGGRPVGHLLRDSSIYDMAVVEKPGSCVYYLRIPMSELGIQGTPGTRFGLSLQLNDNDGAGLAGQMNWGGGLNPSWNPMDFGIVTLTQ